MHFFHSVRLSHWRVSQTNVCSMLRKIRFLNFVSLGQAAHIAYAFIRLCPRYRVLRFRFALHKIRLLKIPSGSFLGFRYKISYSRNFFASPVIHLGALRSGFALTFLATPPFAKIFDFVQNGSSWRRIFAIINFLFIF